MTLEFLALAAWVAGFFGAIRLGSAWLRAFCVVLLVSGTAVLSISADRQATQDLLFDLCEGGGPDIYHSNDVDEADCDVISKFFRDFY
jgi:hypothetical protein